MMDESPSRAVDDAAALHTILQGTAAATGEDFFRALVENLAKALGVMGAWVTEYDRENRRLRARAFIMQGAWIDEYEYDLAGTPCEVVIDSAEMFHLPDNVIALYPEDTDLVKFNAVSFMGVPLLDRDGEVLGHLSVLDSEVLPQEDRVFAIFRIFAARAQAELQRIRAEEEIREREAQLGRLVNSAMDAIIELDDALHVNLINPAAESAFACSQDEISGRAFSDFLAPESGERLRAFAVRVEHGEDCPGAMWLPGGLEARTAQGEPFPAEATLACAKVDGRPHFTLILRDMNERLAAELRIDTLTAEAEYLRQELDSLTPPKDIVGDSPALRSALKAAGQVAPTDATVLILGETGVGKEVFAKAIHEGSDRSGRPLVKVNCAAIPATLMESEFFGHEKGAFTGATDRREGRFALADGGTIFLDEVGELPLELQAKLLRVLQEGEFEAVGSAITRTVDVRVVAATNRDLEERVRAGAFREDLFYRLNVFPIRVPALRERGDDIAALAELFAERFARRMGRPLSPLSPACKERLQSYDWPGNVRELENVIERAVITSENGVLNLAQMIPAGEGAAPTNPDKDESARVLTAADFQRLERDNIRRALEMCAWKVSGDGGAAGMLGMKPSTLSSRIKTLGIERP